MHPLLQDVKNLVLDTLFPVQCLGCNREGLFLCANCQNKLQQVKYQVCIKCRKPSIAGLTHPACVRDDFPTGLLSAFQYSDPLLDQAIIWGKYKFLPDLYRLLGKLLCQHIEQNNYHQLFNEAIVCPIPLAKSRLRWRGFNQTEVISKELAQHFGWTLVPLLQRIKNTKTQKDLTKVERLNNIRQSFSIINTHQIKNKSVILIDDVITTGATLLEGSKLLQSAGAKQVWCLTLARD